MEGGIEYRKGMRSLDNDTPGENNRKGVTSACDVVYDGGRVQTELDKGRISIQVRGG